MARSANAGRISINLSAGTAQFVVDMEKANAKIKQLGDSANHSVSGVQATSAALRTLEGGVTNNLRAAENFLAKTLNLGEVLKHAFPVVGAIAFGGVIFELGKKVVEAAEAFKKLQEAPKRIAQEFDALAQPIRITNDELAVSNARLENEIAKLEGRPQNNLRLALAEAAVSADKLAESLNRTFEAEQKLLESESLSSIKGLFVGQAPTSDLAEQFKTFRDKLTQISLDANSKLEKESDPTKRAAIYKGATDQRIEEIRRESGYLREQLSVAEAIAKRREAALKNPVFDSSPYGLVQRRGGGEEKAAEGIRISTLRGELEPLQAVLAGVPLKAQNDALKKQKDGLEASAANAKLGAPVRDKIRELQAELAGVQNEARAAAAVDPTASNSLITEALAKGAAEADKAITALRVHLEPLKQKLTFAQVIDITNLELGISLASSQKKRADDWLRTQKEIIKGAEELADKLRTEETARQALLGRMGEQIAEAQKLAGVEVAGSEAVFQAQLKIKLAKIGDPDIRAKTEALDEAEHAGEIAKTVAQIDRETAATQRLQAALSGGDDARRRAELANIGASGESPDVIAAQQRAKRAQYQLEDASQLKGLPASAGVQAYFTEMVDQAQSAAAQVKEVLTGAFDSVNDNLARAISGQKTSWESLFQSLSAQVAKMTLQTAETGLVKQFGGALFGGGSSGGGPWNEKAPGGGILGKIGGIFGLGGSGTRDGNSTSSALYVQMVGVGDDSASAGPALSQLLGLSGADAGSDGGGGIGGALGGLLNMIPFGGFFASGGSVDPGQAYIVGENGPELFQPPSAGSIVPNHALGGNTIYYSIDARGTDPVQAEQRTRSAIVAAHQSAVSTSLQANREQVKRAPQ